MKSSAHKALASLQHKYRALIKQHGKLKNEFRTLNFGEVTTGRTTGATTLFAADYVGAERRAESVFTETMLRDNIAELETTIERLEFDLRAARQRGTPNQAYRDDVLRAENATRFAQNLAAAACSDRDDARQAVWVYGLLSFTVGVLGTYGTLFAYGVVPGIY